MTGTILIVDDSLTVRMNLAEAFEAAGLASVPCATLAEARAALASAPVRVIVLDVHLPDGDGVDFLREVRAAPAGAPPAVLLLSSEAEVKDRVRGLKTGADEFVGKPYDTGYLVARARQLCAADGRRSDRPTVLLIDDSPTFRHALEERLAANGYQVLAAGSGEEGLRLAGEERPDAIVVDGVLPGIDGPSVIRRVRLDAALRGTPCLLLTAAEGTRAELHALDAGADSFVRKTDPVEVVLAKLAAAMRHRQGPGPVAGTDSLIGPKRILAVDDSPTFLDAVSEALRDEGYDVVLAHSGEEALELLAVQQVDCILLDLLMPGMRGEETCRRIKSAPSIRDIPLIMLTALEDQDALIEGLGAGADDYISKSDEFEVLRARVRAQLRRRQFEDENRRIRHELSQREREAAEAQAARQLAETRAALAEELERKNRELEAFSYSVSHDLRAPLRAIDGFSQALLEASADRLDPTGQDHLRRVRAAAVRMGELIDDLLALSRVGRSQLSRGRVDLARVAAEVAEELRRGAPDRTVELVIQPDLVVEADARLMRVAFENLLGNAWKFTTRVAAARVEIGARAGGAEREFFVRDNGAGFDPEYAARLFRPFQRLHSTDEFPGTGIGLATVHRIVDRHGGRIRAEGTVGRGATFYFTLPPDRTATIHRAEQRPTRDP